MNRIRILAGVLLVALARPSSAAPIEAVVGFESLPPRLFTVDPRRFGGSFILATDNGIGLTVEAVDFTAAGIAGDFPDGFPESYPDGSGKYLAHGRQSLMPFTPVGKKGYSLRLGDDRNPRRSGDLFDLVSMDITNFVRPSSTSLEYHPATVQLNAQSTPAAYTRGTEANGWESLSTPGNLTHTVGKIKFENVQVSDSTDPAFPANQFRGIRNAFIRLDDIRGVDNVKVRWSHDNFNVPAAVNIMQQELTGPGVMADGTAVFHRPSVEASGNSGPIDVTST